VALLAVLVLTLSRSLSGIPLPLLQFIVGILLLMFGMRWLRKAVLRAAGVLPLHNEDEAYSHKTASMRQQGGIAPTALDKIAFVATFKTVMLEGIEVVFIVLALGADGRLIVPAALGACLALAVVVVLGFWLHRPLARVPENTLKFGVGVMLAAFGTFWAGEGAGLHWPGADAAILVLMLAFLAMAVALVSWCRRLHGKVPAAAPASPSHPAAAPNAIVRMGGTLIGLFVDDGGLAAAIVIWAVGAWVIEQHRSPVAPADGLVFAAGILVLMSTSALRRARSA
jgi:uncharacterized membrane protein